MGFSPNIFNFQESPGFSANTLALRPLSAVPGTIYLATDTQAIYRYQGGAWVEYGGSSSGLVPETRTLTIAGDTQDLSANRVWDDFPWQYISDQPTLTIGGVSQDISTNRTWNAFPWSGITGKPTTLAGYGITDAVLNGIAAGNVNIIRSGGSFIALRASDGLRFQPLNAMIRVMPEPITATRASTPVMFFEATINQTGASGYNLLDFQVTPTSVGTGARNIIRANVAGSDVFNLNDDGRVSCYEIGTRGTITGGNGVWRLGRVIAGAITVDTANYVQVRIEGVEYKLVKAV